MSVQTKDSTAWHEPLRVLATESQLQFEFALWRLFGDDWTNVRDAMHEAGMILKRNGGGEIRIEITDAGRRLIDGDAAPGAK